MQFLIIFLTLGYGNKFNGPKHAACSVPFKKLETVTRDNIQ